MSESCPPCKPMCSMCLNESNGCKKELGDVSLVCHCFFFCACFFQVLPMRAYLFPCSKANEGECGVVAELILGKGIVSKSSLSLHTQNFKLKKKLFQISFLNSFINAIFAWKLWVRERTQLHERWRHVGGEEAKSCPPCIPHPFLPPFYP